jgi:hypothetical protein
MIGTVPELNRPDVSAMIRNGTGAETERFVTRALHWNFDESGFIIGKISSQLIITGSEKPRK